jgi:hypothetical protein
MTKNNHLKQDVFSSDFNMADSKPTGGIKDSWEDGAIISSCRDAKLAGIRDLISLRAMLCCVFII